ncbi:MAG TPA: GAF domain-containing protein [Candidatus Krumholzibacteria bacterium]|nr:GAF domain-containing protein [Candidatus Krumholzibacteria bacterium]
MKAKRVKFGILGGSEAGLYVLAELHKHPGVDIAFVYDRNPSAVAVEIAEILGVPAVVKAGDIRTHLPVDFVAVDDTAGFSTELEIAHGMPTVSYAAALERFGKPPAAKPGTPAPAPAVGDALDDALSRFERLFDRTRLLKSLLDLAVDATGASNGSIMLFSQEAQELYIAYATGLSERVVRNTRQKLGEGISGAVARERKGKLIRDSAPYPVDRDRAHINSACSVPLVDGDTLLGVLNVSSIGSTRELTVSDLETLTKFTHRMARVLADSMRLQQVQLHRGDMTLRQSLGELAERSGSTAEKFALLSSLVARATGAESVEVFVSTQSGEWLVLGGSNRRLSGSPEFVRVGRGALARAFLERRTIVLTEPVDPQSGAVASSFVFVPLLLSEALGVAMVEFTERARLDEFMSVKESVALELARFIGNERRERRLRAELASLARVSEAAPALLGCQTLQDLAEVVARVLVDALDCERVSVRLRGAPGQPWTVARYDGAARDDGTWQGEDEERFSKLEKKGAPYHLSLVDFSAKEGEATRPAHSVLAVPLKLADEVVAGVVAYDRRTQSAVEEAAFSPHDETVIEQVLAMAWPAARGLATGSAEGRPTYDEMIAGNDRRLLHVVEAEMSRADRYHHPFSVLVIRIPAMSNLFRADEARALQVADDIRQGIQTRTRKTDFGCWIHRDTYALASLEGSGRIHFLVSRLAAYLHKDLGNAGVEPHSREVLIGTAAYPGLAQTAEALITEAGQNLKAHPAS